MIAEARVAEAEVELNRLAIKSTDAGVPMMLGTLQHEVGRFEEAEQNFHRTLALDPSCSPAYQGIVAGRSMTEADLPMARRMEELLIDSSWETRFSQAVADSHRMTLRFALGKFFDDLGNYEVAIRHFDEANVIRDRLAPFDETSMEARATAIRSRCDGSFFERCRGRGSPDATPIVVVGMPRSGTTLLERVLAGCAGVRACGELEFWGDRATVWLEGPEEAFLGRALDACNEYLSILRGKHSEIIRAIDKMPYNFQWLGVIHALFPNATLIHLRRNPLDTCLSIYTTPMRLGSGYPSSRGGLVAYYTFYAQLMRHWRSVVPADRLIEVDYEALVSSPQDTARRVVEFCGLRWDAACVRTERVPDAVRTASAWQVRQPISRRSVDRWRRYEPWLGKLRELLPAGME